nr:hypothetical protein [uncultured Neokomagataea sp.]
MAGFNWKGLITPALTMATPFLASLISGRGTRYETIAQQAVSSAVVTVNQGLDHVRDLIDVYERTNPLVSEAISTFQTLASAAGVSIPSIDVIETHIKAAVGDLAAIVVQPKTPVTGG